MRWLAAGIVGSVLAVSSAGALADTVTNIDLTPLYNGNWSTAINGPAIQAGAESVTGNTGSGLSFQDPTGSFVEMFWNGSGMPPTSIIVSLSVALSSSSVVNGLFNNFFGSAVPEATVVFTNSNSDTASFNLVGGQTIRDYNNDGFVNTITGSNANPATDGDVTAQPWWGTDTGGSSPGTPGSPSSRLDAQTFYLPSSWNGTNLTSIQITDTDVINADLILTALQVDVATPVSAVPEPASIALLGGGLLGLGAMRRRRP